MRKGMLAAEEGAAEIEVDLPLPVLFGQAFSASREGAADIVHQDVQAAEGRDTGFDGARDLGRRGGIGDMSDRLAAFAADDPERFLDSLVTVIEGEDRGPLPRQQNSGGFPVAPAWAGRPGAGHDRHLPVEPQHACLALSAPHGAPQPRTAAQSPPSTRISVPVMYFASSDAKKSAAFATSQASPMRPIGTCSCRRR